MQHWKFCFLNDIISHFEAPLLKLVYVNYEPTKEQDPIHNLVLGVFETSTFESKFF
jgi:hypothetical protein